MNTKGDGNRKPTAGDTATKGLGTSKAVLSTLKLVGEEDELAFLKAAADAANGILSGIRDIEDGEIDGDFAALAMDACGLVYIVITLCGDILNHHGEIPDQTKVDSGGLTRDLEEVQTFVHKKLHRKLYQRILKHASDEQKVQSYRDQLRCWQGKFGLNSDNAIHDSLQDIVDEKLRKLDLEEHAARKARGSSTHPDVCSTRPSISPPIEKPLPTIILSAHLEKENPSPPPDLSNSVLQKKDNETQPANIKEETEGKRKERLEEERRRKKAERERWRKSEQEFAQLPEAKVDGNEIITPFLPNIRKPSSSQSLRPIPDVHNVPPKLLPTVSTEDKKIAEDLHYSTQKELEAEDERQAILLAAKIQREWEAEEQEMERRSVSLSRGARIYPNADEKTLADSGRTSSTQASYPTYNRSNTLKLKPQQSS